MLNLLVTRIETHMALFTLARSTWRVIGLTGIVCSLILRYAAPLSNAAWAEAGTILEGV